jgi:hypothetical protein
VWSGCDPQARPGSDSLADAAWDPLEQFKEAYPDFKLEDELFRLGGGAVLWTPSLTNSMEGALRNPHQPRSESVIHDQVC